MAFNGDGPFNKRMRTDGESVGQKSNVHYYTDNDYYTPDQNDGDNVSSELMGEACETTGETNPNGPYGGFSDYDNQPRRRKGEPETPNHVLLMTILNPAYPITVDVIHTICQPYGNVLRIVIFKKNGVQAMVEFDGIDPATRAREGLQGADIYSGCCTLRIEYAKPSKLNVYKNDAESWDFTNPNVGGGMNGQMGGGPRGGGGLFNSPMPDRFGINNGMSNGGIRSGGLMGSGQGQGGPFMGGAGGPGGASLSAMGQPQPGLPQQGAVLMVYGLNKDKMNADRIFNLLCLYGNIVRIKFLKTKEGCAMVQMGDALAVERAVANLNNTTFFGCKMQLGYSKQAFLADVQQPYDLPDGTPSFKDYMGNKNNRFINPEMASKNRIQPPSKILHFFNTPPGLDEETLKQVFLEGEVVEPKSIKLFPSKTERSSSGLLEFNNISEALEALVVGNHAPIPNPNSKFPFIMKLCFSSSRHIPNKMAE
ncbi:hypothetical protein O3P69_016316 [Scylla paramamosain]|uniref:RRM domain-containing protein n=1 Tax=Scylla paramamosain TaxID=85552 RepID=A0AAW0TCJ8_SCYPA